jgi:hypothetical protein
MKHEMPRIAVGRLRRVAAIAGALAVIGVGSEAALLYMHRHVEVVPSDRSKEFSFVPGAGSASETNQASIDLILADPLFVQGRGKAPPPVTAVVQPLEPPPPAPEPEIHLVGIQLSERARLAIIQLSDSDRAVRAVEGQPVAGWIVARILPDHVELTKETRTRSVYLGDTKAPSEDEATSQ